MVTQQKKKTSANKKHSKEQEKNCRQNLRFYAAHKTQIKILKTQN